MRTKLGSKGVQALPKAQSTRTAPAPASSPWPLLSACRSSTVPKPNTLDLSVLPTDKAPS